MKQSTLDRVHVVATLPSGKEIGWREVGTNRFKEICFKDGGQIPDNLGGMWTDPFAIEREIKSYVTKLELAAAKAAEAKAKKAEAKGK